MRNTKNILWGFIFLILGLLSGANAVGLINFNLFFAGWWTLVIILPCLVGLFTDRNKVGNAIFLAIGVFLLLKEQGIVGYDIVIKLIIPSAFIAYGVFLLNWLFFYQLYLFLLLSSFFIYLELFYLLFILFDNFNVCLNIF